MKKKYLIPQMEVITIEDNHLLAGSITSDGTYANKSDAPEMMNLPEENEQTEYEE